MLFNDNYEVKLSIFFDNIMWYYYLKKGNDRIYMLSEKYI
jgi:hypothetical protein